MKESDKINSSSHSLKGGGIQFSPMNSVGRITNGLFLPFIIQPINKIPISGHTSRTLGKPS
jgi:hypothetical protein